MTDRHRSSTMDLVNAQLESIKTKARIEAENVQAVKDKQAEMWLALVKVLDGISPSAEGLDDLKTLVSNYTGLKLD